MFSNVQYVLDQNLKKVFFSMKLATLKVYYLYQRLKLNKFVIFKKTWVID